jgi:hypothetical protein
MSNKLASLTCSLVYTGPNGEIVKPPDVAISAPYQAESVGIVDVPDATTTATVFTIPFGPIGTECTLAVVDNNTGQDLSVKLNGAGTASHRIPAGGRFVHAAPAAGSAGTPLTSMTLTTTGTQAGAGSIAYRLFGDPV